MTSRLDALIDAAYNMDLPERYREAAQTWVRLDGQARELEDGKEHAFAKRTKTINGGSLAAAEREVKSTQEWRDILMEIARARTAANQAQTEMDYWRMKFEQWRLVRQQEEMAA